MPRPRSCVWIHLGLSSGVEDEKPLFDCGLIRHSGANRAHPSFTDAKQRYRSDCTKAIVRWWSSIIVLSVLFTLSKRSSIAIIHTFHLNHIQTRVPDLCVRVVFQKERLAKEQLRTKYSFNLMVKWGICLYILISAFTEHLHWWMWHPKYTLYSKLSTFW